jgi:hypothetical protein
MGDQVRVRFHKMFGSTRRCSEEAVIRLVLAAGWRELTHHTLNDPSHFGPSYSFSSPNWDRVYGEESSKPENNQRNNRREPKGKRAKCRN